MDGFCSPNCTQALLNNPDLADTCRLFSKIVHHHCCRTLRIVRYIMGVHFSGVSTFQWCLLRGVPLYHHSTKLHWKILRVCSCISLDVRMQHVTCSLSPLLIVSCTDDVRTNRISITINVLNDANKRGCLLHSIQKNPYKLVQDEHWSSWHVVSDMIVCFAFITFVWKF